MSSSDKLVMMANQIARNLAIRGEAEAIRLTADHITKFWDPRMRAKLLERFDEEPARFDELTRRALQTLATG